jgi:crossover junction endodeoxyribonuclease RusA
VIELCLPYPPSVNAMWRTPRTGPLAGRTMLSQEGRKYREAAGNAVVLQRCPGIEPSARLQVEIEARMPDRRKRDLDNLPKAILDALTHAGVWADDGQIDDLRVWRSPKLTGEVIVRITPLALPACPQGELLGAAA